MADSPLHTAHIPHPIPLSLQHLLSPTSRFLFLFRPPFPIDTTPINSRGLPVRLRSSTWGESRSEWRNSSFCKRQRMSGNQVMLNWVGKRIRVRKVQRYLDPAPSGPLLWTSSHGYSCQNPSFFWVYLDHDEESQSVPAHLDAVHRIRNFASVN